MEHHGSTGYLNPEQRSKVIQWLQAKGAWHLSELQIYLKDKYEVVFKSKQSYYDREVQGIAAQSAFALAKSGDFPSAVEALEQGLARLLSEALDLDRADLAQLQKLGKEELCDRYQAVTEQ